MEIESVIIRKSPVILVYRIIAITFVIYILFTLYSVFVHQELTDDSLRSILTEKVLFLLSSVGAEAIAIITLFLQWSYSTYEIRNTELIARTGIFWRSQEVHSLKNMQAVYIKQHFFGTLFGYATLQLHNPLSKEEVRMDNIPEPYKYAEVLQNALENAHDKGRIIPRS